MQEKRNYIVNTWVTYFLHWTHRNNKTYFLACNNWTATQTSLDILIACKSSHICCQGISDHFEIKKHSRLDINKYNRTINCKQTPYFENRSYMHTTYPILLPTFSLNSFKNGHDLAKEHAQQGWSHFSQFQFNSNSTSDISLLFSRQKCLITVLH